MPFLLQSKAEHLYCLTDPESDLPTASSSMPVPSPSVSNSTTTGEVTVIIWFLYEILFNWSILLKNQNFILGSEAAVHALEEKRTSTETVLDSAEVNLSKYIYRTCRSAYAYNMPGQRN